MIGNVITEWEANGVRAVFSNPEIVTDKTWIEIPEKDIVKISYNVTIYSEKNENGKNIEEKILDIKTSNFSAILNIPELIIEILENNFQNKTWQYLYKSNGLTRLRRSVSTDKLINEDFYEISRFVDVDDKNSLRQERFSLLIGNSKEHCEKPYANSIFINYLTSDDIKCFSDAADSFIENARKTPSDEKTMT